MEPNQSPVAPEVTEVKDTAPSAKWYSPLCCVTKTSKLLAALTMIILPFAGGYVGWLYGFQDGIDAPTTWNLPTENSINVSQYSSEELSQLIKMKEEFDLKLLQEKLKQQIEAFVGTSSLPEVNSESVGYFEFGWLVFQPDAESNILVSEQVTYKDEQAKEAASKPYLNFVTKIDSQIILTAGCFKATECTYSGLYKFDTRSKEISTMKSGDLYVPMYTGGLLSPDKTKIALSPYREYTTLGTEFGYIDLVSDTYHNLISLDILGNSRFTLCEMGCSTETSWLSNMSVMVTEFNYSSCGGGNNCLSDYKTENGEIGNTTSPISTTSRTFNI